MASIHHRAQVISIAIGLAAIATVGACTQIPSDGSEDIGSSQQAIVKPPEPACASGEIDPSRSLLVTDPQVLDRFALQPVLDQIIALASVSGPGSLELYQRWWDSQNAAPGVFPDAIHCNSEVTPAGAPAINGFPIQCPRNEGALATSNPFVSGPDFMKPIAVVNRFDLAPTDGSHCGEYRIIYAKKSGETDILNRNLIIFEAVLPNPDPSCGVAACRPVAEHWASLSADPDPVSRADAIEDFYFNGLPGFAPVIHPAHYGMNASGGGYGSTSRGQIRTNQFMPGPNQQIWQLREFQLARTCSGGPIGTFPIDPVPVDGPAVIELGEEEPPQDQELIEASNCRLAFKPVTVKNNPFGALFNFTSTEPRAAPFRDHFISDVEPLSDNSVAGMGMATPDLFNAGQSNSQGQENEYRVHLNNGGAGNPFIQSIGLELGSLDRGDLLTDNIADRATTQSCAGCHQLSNDDRLGGIVDPKWPRSAAPPVAVGVSFVHVSESSAVSLALRHVFLPRRKQILASFLDATCGHTCTTCGDEKGIQVLGSAPLDGMTLGGSKTH